MRSPVAAIAGMFLLASSGAAGAGQPANPLADLPLGRQVATGIRACIAIMKGDLTLNPPSPKQDAAGLVLAEPTAPDELKPFSDLSPRDRIFAAVKGSDSVVVAHDPSQKLCRVAVLHTKDVSPATAFVGPLGTDWVYVTGDALQNFDVFTGTILGSQKMTFRIRQPPAGNTTYVAATYMFSFLPAS